MWLAHDHRTRLRGGRAPGAHGPEGTWSEPGPGRPTLRILVTVESLERAGKALALATRLAGPTASLRILHVRMWDRVPRGGGRFFFESSLEATATVDAALRWVWRAGVAASGVVVEAPRARIAEAVVDEANRWSADTVVLTLCPRRHAGLGFGVWDRVSRQVMRRTTLPVVAVHPGPD